MRPPRVLFCHSIEVLMAICGSKQRLSHHSITFYIPKQTVAYRELN
jgi:hypothetical protein